MDDRFRIGRIGVEQGLLTEDDLLLAIRRHRQADDGRRLGQVLVDEGLLDADQLVRLQAIQAARLDSTDAFSGRPIRETLFGRRVVDRGYCTEEQVHEALREADGTRRLGQILVDRGDLSAEQLRRILEDQDKEILTCPRCEKHFNVLGYRKGYSLRCLVCRTPLVGTNDPSAIDAAEELFFDVEKAENVGLLGHLAVEGKYVTQAALDQALRAQEDAGADRPLGRVLVDLELIDEDQLEALLDLQGQVERREEAIRTHRRRRTLFGKLAVGEGLLTGEMVHRALLVQNKEMAIGARRRLGTILIELFLLTETQCLHLLGLQGRKVARCEACEIQFNLIEHIEAEVPCPRCAATLVLPERPASLAAIEDLVIGEKDEALLELEMEIERSGGDLSATRQVFRTFYERESFDSILDDDEQPPADALVPLEAGRRRMALRRAQIVAGRPGRLLPLVAVGFIVIALVASVAGYLVTAPADVDREAVRVIVAPPPPEPELAEGARISALGYLTAGPIGQVVIVEGDVQAFLFEARPDEFWWAFDPTGRSRRPLTYLLASGTEEHRPLSLLARYRAALPPGVPPPPRPVEGYLELESWRPFQGAGRPPESLVGLRVVEPAPGPPLE